jgi:hypothetical protein
LFTFFVLIFVKFNPVFYIFGMFVLKPLKLSSTPPKRKTTLNNEAFGNGENVNSATLIDLNPIIIWSGSFRHILTCFITAVQ